MAYAWMELRVMTQVLRGNRDCDQMVHDFLVSAHAAVRRILDVDVVLEPGSITPDRDAARGAADPSCSGIAVPGTASSSPGCWPSNTGCS